MQALMMTAIQELQLVDVPEPEIVRPTDALIEIRAAGICGSDLHGYTGQTGRRKPPIVMGHEASGVVTAVGDGVERVTPGDRVAIHPITMTDGVRRLLGMDAQGAYAPRVVWPAANLYKLPTEVSFEAGSLAEPLAVVIHAIEKVDLTRAGVAVVVGAGPIGLLVAAMLKHMSLQTVVVTDLSYDRLSIAERLGADATIDPSASNAMEEVRQLSDGRGADVAFEAVGISATVRQAQGVVRDGGTVVWIGNNQRMVELDMQEVVTRELSIQGTYGMTGDDFQTALDVLASGAIPADVIINRRARLDEGPTLFDELLSSPDVVKCVFTFP